MGCNNNGFVTLPKEPGLRERKRAATRRDIERAALELALDKGFANVTVDQISEAAGVSPRTFFNYFASKDAAVLGHAPELPDEIAIEAFVAAGRDEQILDGIRVMLSSVLEEKSDVSPEDAREAHRLRRKLLMENPHLFAVRMTTMEELEHSVIELVSRRLLRDEPELVADEPELRSRARLLALVAFAGLRHGWMCWAETGGTGELADSIRDSFEQMHRLSSVYERAESIR